MQLLCLLQVQAWGHLKRVYLVIWVLIFPVQFGKEIREASQMPSCHVGLTGFNLKPILFNYIQEFLGIMFFIVHFSDFASFMGPMLVS